MVHEWHSAGQTSPSTWLQDLGEHNGSSAAVSRILLPLPPDHAANPAAVPVPSLDWELCQLQNGMPAEQPDNQVLSSNSWCSDEVVADQAGRS